jgi:hypothetical protein
MGRTSKELSLSSYIGTVLSGMAVLTLCTFSPGEVELK